MMTSLPNPALGFWGGTPVTPYHLSQRGQFTSPPWVPVEEDEPGGK